MAEALYRKYRPQVFEDVVGQEPIERTLKNAIVQDKVSHAYLFTGPRGTGKTTTARLLAKALLCQTGPTPDPDGTCDDCLLIADGVHPDVYELDAASRTGVENVREEIISRVSFAPTRGRYKVYIIDEVHMLSPAAFNALLKTLEEPPSHVVFVLCTTDPQKVPETIHSRCQRFDFRRITPESMVSRLGAICIAEDVEFEGEALDLIAHRADGGLRNALTSLEQIIAFENGKVTLAGAERLLGSIDSTDMAEIISYIGRRDIANCFRWTANYVETGADLAQFVRDMAEHVRNLYVMAIVDEDVELDVSETARRELIGELQWFGPDRLARLLGVLGDLSAELKTSSNPRLAFEISLTRMVRPDSDLTLEALAERVEALESGYSAVAHVLPGEPVRFGGEQQVNPDPFPDVPSFGGDDRVRPHAAYGDAPQGERVEQPARVDSGRGNVSQQPQAGGAWAMPATGDGAGARQPEAAVRAQQPVDRGESTARPAAADQQGAASARPAAQAEMAGRAEVRPGGQAGQMGQAGQGSQAGQAGQTGQGSQGGRAGSAGQGGHARQEAPSGSASQLAPLANPAALQRIWQAALSSLKKQKQAYGVLFMSAKARYDETAGMLKIVFPDESAFAFNAVQKPDVRDALSASLAQAMGGQVPFAYEKAGSPSTTAASSAPVQTAAEARPATQARAHAQAQPAPAQQPAQQERSTFAQQPAGQERSAFAQQPTGQGQSASVQQPAQQAVQSAAAVAQPEAATQPAAQPAAATGQFAAQPAQQAAQPAAAVAQPEAATQTAAQPAATTSQFAAQPAYQAAQAPWNDPNEQPPWDQVPYDEMPYEPVPYEEFDAGYEPVQAAPFDAPTVPSGAASQNAAPQNAASQNAASADMGSEDAADIEAMLQAGFGGGVVFSEVE